MELKARSSAAAIAQEERFGAHNYHPLPVVLEKVKVSISGISKENAISILLQLIQLSTRAIAIPIIAALIEQAQTLH